MQRLPRKDERIVLRLRHVGHVGHVGHGHGRRNGRLRLLSPRLGITETLVLLQLRRSLEGVPAFATLYGLSALGVHALVPTEIGELRVGFTAHAASEGFDAAVYVGVLFEPRTGGEGLAALGARVTARTSV